MLMAVPRDGRMPRCRIDRDLPEGVMVEGGADGGADGGASGTGEMHEAEMAEADGAASPLTGKLVLLKVAQWLENHKFPMATVQRVLGVPGEVEAERRALLFEHDLVVDEYSAEAIACLPEPNWEIPMEELERRLDLRHMALCSVDPPGAMDIDDALHAIELAPGRFEVGVHIADVGYFVKEGSALNEEAAKRGTTCYLVDSRVEMLPKRLSQDLCSLHSGVDRLAFSVLRRLTYVTCVTLHALHTLHASIGSPSRFSGD